MKKDGHGFRDFKDLGGGGTLCRFLLRLVAYADEARMAKTCRFNAGI